MARLTWYDGGLKPDWPEDLPTERRLDSGGTIYVGDRGVLLANSGGDPLLLPESRRAQYQPPSKTLPRSIGRHAEWIEACKGGEPAGAEFQFAGLVTQVVLLGNIALRIGDRSADSHHDQPMPKLQWGGGKLQFTNVPEANQYLQRKYRNGWAL